MAVAGKSMSEEKYVAEELGPLILHADNHLLAVNKPAGLLTQDSGTGLATRTRKAMYS